MTSLRNPPRRLRIVSSSSSTTSSHGVIVNEVGFVRSRTTSRVSRHLFPVSSETGTCILVAIVFLSASFCSFPSSANGRMDNEYEFYQFKQQKNARTNVTTLTFCPAPSTRTALRWQILVQNQTELTDQSTCKSAEWLIWNKRCQWHKTRWILTSATRSHDATNSPTLTHNKWLLCAKMVFLLKNWLLVWQSPRTDTNRAFP